jgi:membrane protein involved in colicin uptake
VQSLAGLKNLKRLYVWQTKVTEEGQAKFKAAAPNVRIVPDFALDKKLAQLEAVRKAEADAKAKVEEEAKKKMMEEEAKKKAEEEAKKKQ